MDDHDAHPIAQHPGRGGMPTVMDSKAVLVLAVAELDPRKQAGLTEVGVREGRVLHRLTARPGEDEIHRVPSRSVVARHGEEVPPVRPQSLDELKR